MQSATASERGRPARDQLEEDRKDCGEGRCVGNSGLLRSAVLVPEDHQGKQQLELQQIEERRQTFYMFCGSSSTSHCTLSFCVCGLKKKNCVKFIGAKMSLIKMKKKRINLREWQYLNVKKFIEIVHIVRNESSSGRNDNVKLMEPLQYTAMSNK